MTLTAHPAPSPGLLPGGSGSPAPTASGTATAATEPPRETLACAPGDLAAVADAWGAAAGSRGTMVKVTNTSSTACTLAGRPGARLENANGVLADAGGDPTATPPQPLEPGASLVTSLVWSNWCGSDPAQPIGVTLVLPGGDLTVTPDAASPDVLVPPCMGSSDRNVLSTIDFLHRRRPSSRTHPRPSRTPPATWVKGTGRHRPAGFGR